VLFVPLTDKTIRKAKPEGKPVRLFDGRGLYLEVAPSGGKWWRWKYRFSGKEKRLSFGVYPEVSLMEARDVCDDARKLLKSGVDPSQQRKSERQSQTDKAANSFEVVAREWLSKNKTVWSEGHTDRVISLFEHDILPFLGTHPVSEIEAPELLTTMRRIEARGAIDTAHRALGHCWQVFRYGIATSRCKRNPAADLRGKGGALTPVKSGHFAAATEPEQLAKILRLLEAYEGTLTVRCALRLAPLVFVRPGELRKAEWSRIDLDKAEWRYTTSKTKIDLIVPLSRQAVAILHELHPLTGHGKLVFPGARSSKRPMSDNAVLAAMRSMEISKEEMTGHGFRASARTVLDEVLKFRPDIIDHQLGHKVKDPNGRAYNRTSFLPERRKMMQQWADYLDKLKDGTKIIPINQAG
jgi:integrase